VKSKPDAAQKLLDKAARDNEQEAEANAMEILEWLRAVLPQVQYALGEGEQPFRIPDWVTRLCRVVAVHYCRSNKTLLLLSPQWD
jgi:hypothetical protein